jgi:hypothetical protein
MCTITSILSRTILRADPGAHVGGPAIANYRSPLLPALLDAAGSRKIPLSFISWHIYNSDPKAVQATVEYQKDQLAKYHSLHPETILDEWNMALTVPPKDPRIQPAYVAETAWRMKGPELLLFLPHSRLPRGPRSVCDLHLAGWRFLHGELVEPHAAVLWVVRLSERHRGYLGDYLASRF